MKIFYLVFTFLVLLPVFPATGGERSQSAMQSAAVFGFPAFASARG